MKKLAYIVLAWFALGFAAVRAETVDMEAFLIRASNESAPLDYHLDAVVPKLRKIFQFTGYELLGQGSGAVNTPGETTMDLGKGHSLELKIRREKGDRFKAEVRWVHDGKALVSTSVSMSRNQPVVLGGSKEGNGTLIVTLTAK